MTLRPLQIVLFTTFSLAIFTTAATVPRFAYVANVDDNTISLYTVGPSTGFLRANGYAIAGSSPRSLALVGTKFLYAANLSSNNISGFVIDAVNGRLTPITGSPFSNGTQPYAIAAHPLGNFVYVANSSSNSVSAYAVNTSSGALTPISGSPFAAGSHPQAVAISASGKFLYVANFASNNVSVYFINSTTGSLRQVSGSPFPSGSQPFSLKADRLDKFLYVANSGSNNVSEYRINATTGALIMIAAPVPAGLSPRSITVDNSGRFAYVANTNSNNVSAYSINATTGALTQITGSPFKAGTGTRSVNVDPSNQFLFATNLESRDISRFRINASIGTLAPVRSIRSRGQAQDLAVSPSNSPVTYADTFAYLVQDDSGELLPFDINATGSLVQLPGGASPELQLQPLTVDPFAKFLFLAGFDTLLPCCSHGAVETFLINSSTGQLTKGSGSPLATGTEEPVGAIVDASGRFLYVNDFPDILAYTIDPTTGGLTKIGGFPRGSGGGPFAMDPMGTFLFAGGDGGQSMISFKINKNTGALTQTSVLPAATLFHQVVADPSGRFLYIGEEGANTILKVTTFSVNGASGKLTKISSFQTLNGVADLTVDPYGRFLFGGTGGDGRGILGLRINASGALSQIPGSPFRFPDLFVSNIVTVRNTFSGKFLYVIDGGDTLRGFNVNNSTGAVTAISGFSFGNSVTPVGIAPIGRVH